MGACETGHNHVRGFACLPLSRIIQTLLTFNESLHTSRYIDWNAMKFLETGWCGNS